MDAKWLDRELVDRELADKGDQELQFNPETYRYQHEGVPFTGISVGRYPDGKLQSVVHFVDGLATGVSAAWYPNGQIELYREMEEDVCHGARIEWNQDGTKTRDEIYARGSFVRQSP